MPLGSHNISSRAIKALVILGFAALYVMLYLRGLDFGRPICEHCDEWAIVEQVMHVAAYGPFSPLPQYAYGGLPIFLQSGVCYVLHAYNNLYGVYRDAEGHPIRKDLEQIAAGPADRDLFRFYYAGRLLVAFYAALLFWIVYMLGVRLFANRLAACLCVLAVMLNPLMVQQAHFVLPNVLAALLAVAAVYCSVAFLDGGNRRILYLGALLSGLAIGTKITMIWAIAVVLAAALLRLRAASFKHAPLLLLVFAAAFLLVEPYVITDTARFFDDFAYVASIYSQGNIMDSLDLQGSAFGSEALRSCIPRWRFLYPVLYWMHQGLGQFAFTLAGLVILPLLTGRKGALALVFPLLVFLFIGAQRRVLTTNYLPLLPFLALGLGAVSLGVLQWRTRWKQIPAWAAACGVFFLAAVALAAPAKTSFGIVRQFTTKDPYQTALEWIEANTPSNARFAGDRGLKAIFPFTNEGRAVRVEYLMSYWKPYTQFLDGDYMVALAPGMYDRFPWFRPVVTFGIDDPLLRDLFAGNWHLTKQRLILERHITPEECGYVPRAEMPLVAHDVSIYRIPKISPVYILPPEPYGNDIPCWSVAAGGPMTAHAHLDTGRYDVFVTASRETVIAGTPVSITLQVDDQAGCSIPVLDTGSYDYFASTIDLDVPRDVSFRIALGDSSPSADTAIRINRIMCVPITVDEISTTPIQARDR